MHHAYFNIHQKLLDLEQKSLLNSKKSREKTAGIETNIVNIFTLPTFLDSLECTLYLTKQLLRHVILVTINFNISIVHNLFC